MVSKSGWDIGNIRGSATVDTVARDRLKEKVVTVGRILLLFHDRMIVFCSQPCSLTNKKRYSNHCEPDISALALTICDNSGMDYQLLPFYFLSLHKSIIIL